MNNTASGWAIFITCLIWAILIVILNEIDIANRKEYQRQKIRKAKKANLENNLEKARQVLNKLRRKETHTEQDKQEIEYFLTKLKQHPNSKDARLLYYAFEREQQRPNNKHQKILAHTPQPKPHPSPNYWLTQTQTKTTTPPPPKTESPPPPKPIITYPIIKNINDPAFTAPPPPNQENAGQGSAEAQSAQYRLNIYMGIFTHRPNHKRKLSNREKGSRYERYLGYLYERAGWEVDYHGEKMGIYDGGIDLICISRDNEVCHAVQAKLWTRRQVDTQDMRKFIDDFEDIRRGISHHEPQAVFITSNRFTPEARTIAEQHNVILLEKAAMPQSYPLVKCLNGTNGQKKYLLPPILEVGKNGSYEPYVYVSADFTQGDCYVYTCAEAERLGYACVR